MRGMKNHLKLGILLVGISLLLLTCKKEKSTIQHANLETLSREEVISYFEMAKVSSNVNSSNKKQVSPNLKGITQEKINNSSALLTIIPATTIYPEHYSRILMLKINQEIQAVVFSMYSSKESKGENFSGEIMITDLDGNFINGYRVSEGKLKSQFRAKANDNKSSLNYISSVGRCPEHGECYSNSPCIECTQELDEVVVVYASASNNINYYNLFFGFNNFNTSQGGGQYIVENWSFGGAGGGISDISNPVQDSKPKPCPGDPIKNPIIAPTGKGKNGGRYGYTRTYENGAAKFHDGLDIQAAPGSKIYAPFDGIVIDTRNSFAPNEYGANSYGNYVSIKFTLQNEQIIILKYNHLNSVNVTNGTIAAGSIIGTSGMTGNAKDVIPHVHIQARNIINNKEVRTNPEQYLATKFDSQGNPSNQPCQ